MPTAKKPSKSLPNLTSGLDALLARPVATAEITLAWNPDDSEALDVLRRDKIALQIRAERNQDDDEVDDLLEKKTKELAKFEKDIETVTFHFRSIGERAYEQLVFDHPASKEQIEQMRRMTGDQKLHLEFNTETFAGPLIAATCAKIVFSNGTPDVEGLTPDEATELVHSQTFTAGDIGQILSVARDVNRRSSRVTELGNG